MDGPRLPKAAIRLLAALLLALAPALASAGGTAPPAPRPALLAVTLNGKAIAEPTLLLRGEGDALYAPASVVATWRLRLPDSAALEIDGVGYYRLDALPGLRIALSERDQSVTIDADGALFERQSAGFGPTATPDMTPAATGAFLNYDLFAEHVRGDTSLNGALEVGLFTPHGVGTTSFIGRVGDGEDRAVRLETAWTIDRPSGLSTLRLGDSVSAAGPGSVPFRFAGFHYARNFAVQPGFITMPLPTLSGSTAVPSVVDVYVNNVLQGRRELEPGPFDVADIPVQSGGGTVQLVVRDLLGRQVVSEASYYASAGLLRAGLHDFSYEVGFLREDFGRRSHAYGPLVASTTQRYGLSDSLTGQVHAQVSEKRQMAGVGFTALAFDLGQLDVSGSLSRSERGTGTRVSAAFDRRTSGLSFGVRGEYTSAGYAFLSMPDDYRPARISVQAFVDTPFLGGTIGASYIYRDQRGRPNERLAEIFANYRLGGRASVHLFARHSMSERSETSIGAHLSIAFGGHRSASAGVEHGRSTNAYVSYQNDAPVVGGGGYRVTAHTGRARGVDALYSYNLPTASVAAQVSHGGGNTGVRLSAAGALGLVGGHAFASRALGESFASVQVGDYAGVHVYADNQIVGKTDEDGMAIIPALRAFEPNIIRIDEADLPLDVQLPATQLAVRPYARSGTAIRFEPRAERGVLMQVFLEDGAPLPAGARVRVEGADASYVAVSGGEVYIPQLAGRARLQARWAGQTCAFDVTVPDNDDPQPRLEGLTCLRPPAYAAR